MKKFLYRKKTSAKKLSPNCQRVIFSKKNFLLFSSGQIIKLASCILFALICISLTAIDVSAASLNNSQANTQTRQLISQAIDECATPDDCPDKAGFIVSGCYGNPKTCHYVSTGGDTPPPADADNPSINLGDQLILRGGSTVKETYDTPATIVNLLVKNLFVAAGIVIFFLIIGAGLSYLKDSGQGKEEAKNLATGAVIGFIVMFSAYWIIQIIKIITGADIPI